MPTITEDPDVDILMNGNLLKVLIDLRGRNLKSENLIVKADKQGVYIFDKESNNVIKVIKLPTFVDPTSVSFSEKFGTYIITLKKT
ncbi:MULTISPECIES: hypothetical protein [Sulfurisphaera]|uniref:SHSP domain-containing protein n=3 Tax=Sulfurisphaera TaxID=69655 RepID=F9VMM3_SULTO|nr:MULTISPECIES: hypothetical protein [Sulfurisphaera]MBB5253299.1 HSP20 family molecular chaperone IbpA [Sulfurisphaera ohwakuensis]QGR15801.1 hypothetical protein D1869_00285 [Sulfurisphaera ohwakuensis]BAK54169.1 hypothetical protein STK_01675 [Sulfurisphaera tokodaii str. 7]HII74280.1 hypothetical protein [Sulfurisphaera tokodaii]